MDRLHAGVQLVLAVEDLVVAMVLQQNVIYKEGNKMSLMLLTHEKPHGAILFMNETVGIEKSNIFVLVMSQFLTPRLRWHWRFLQWLVIPAVPVDIPSLSIPNRLSQNRKNWTLLFLSSSKSAPSIIIYKCEVSNKECVL